MLHFIWFDEMEVTFFFSLDRFSDLMTSSSLVLFMKDDSHKTETVTDLGNVKILLFTNNVANTERGKDENDLLELQTRSPSFLHKLSVARDGPFVLLLAPARQAGKLQACKSQDVDQWRCLLAI